MSKKEDKELEIRDKELQRLMKARRIGGKFDKWLALSEMSEGELHEKYKHWAEYEVNKERDWKTIIAVAGAIGLCVIVIVVLLMQNMWLQWQLLF